MRFVTAHFGQHTQAFLTLLFKINDTSGIFLPLFDGM